MVRIEHDVDVKETVSDTLDRIDRHNGTLVSTVLTGNFSGATMTIDFADIDAARGFYLELHPDEDEEYTDVRIMTMS